MWTILTDREHSSLLQQEVADALPNYLLKPHVTPPIHNVQVIVDFTIMLGSVYI